jgi:membrane-associated phospholipid phosphatase
MNLISFKSNITKILIGGVLLFLFGMNKGISQITYTLKPSVDYSLVGLGALSLTTGQVLEYNTNSLTEADILKLNPADINPIDRPTIYNNSEKALILSEVLVYGTMASSLLLLADKNIRKEWMALGVMGLETIMITYGLTRTTKTLVLRTRPYVYNPNVDLERKEELDARLSYFSTHTAAAASVSFFAAKVYVDTHPNSKWKPWVWTAAAVLPALNGWTRVASGEHFPTDVLTGYAVGGLIGYFIPVLHLKKDTEKASLSILPHQNGVAMKLVF